MEVVGGGNHREKHDEGATESEQALQGRESAVRAARSLPKPIGGKNEQQPGKIEK
jgi:hypothetical protein